MYVHFYGINVATVISSHSTEGKDSNGKASSKQYCCVIPIWKEMAMQ